MLVLSTSLVLTNLYQTQHQSQHIDVKPEDLKHLKANCGLIVVCVKQSITQSLMLGSALLLSCFRFLVTGFFFDYVSLHQIDQDIHRKYTLSSDAELILIRSLTLGKVNSKFFHYVTLPLIKGQVNRLDHFLQTFPFHSSLGGLRFGYAGFINSKGDEYCISILIAAAGETL